MAGNLITHEDIQKIPLLSLDGCGSKAAEFPTEKEVWREFHALFETSLNTMELSISAPILTWLMPQKRICPG
jgi:hypothetical protein